MCDIKRHDRLYGDPHVTPLKVCTPTNGTDLVDVAINKPALPRGHAPPGRPGGHIMSAHGAHRARRATRSGREHPPYVWNGSPVPMCVGYACVTYPGRYSAARISPSTAPPARGPRRRAAPPPRIKVKIDILKNNGATFAGALLVCAPHTRYGPQTLLGAWVCRI